jgi:hypothetical protein
MLIVLIWYVVTTFGCDTLVATKVSLPALTALPSLLRAPAAWCSMILTATGVAFQRPAVRVEQQVREL